jgi:predicted nucleic acid-binding protein
MKAVMRDRYGGPEVVSVRRVDKPTPGEGDGLLAATALVHDHLLVTLNVRDVKATGARLLDPTS